jgi:hypothetical protein
MRFRLADVSYRLQLDDISPANLRADFENRWRRMAELMPGNWTAEKVEYAWNNGVSCRYPHIRLEPVHWTEEFSRRVYETKIGLYYPYL